jgi:quinol-cytochrome oxidoreductase complex cytochrome b subunit
LEVTTMADDNDERMARPDGHRYDAPESKEETRNKSWDYALLGLLVMVILVLIATGVVPIFNY